MRETQFPEASTRGWDPNALGLPVILGHYRVLGVLGQGGMGTVYLGFHVNLQRFVAIKTLRVDRTHKPALVARFHHEMRLIGQMDHRNVVRAHDAGERDGVFFLVMELLRGSDLERMVRSHGTFSVARACSVLSQAALGLEYIHQTLVHRDIKPSNLMLADGGILKILDLGLARLQEPSSGDATPEGGVMGTYDYLSPEQAVGKKDIDGRSDIYSLGCTLYMLLVGQAPFSGPGYESAGQKLLAHCQVNIADLPAVRSWPKQLADVLARMTAKNRDDRFATAGQAAVALAFFADDLIDESYATSKMSESPVVTPLSGKLPEELLPLTVPAAPTVTADTTRAKPHGRRARWFVFAALSACLAIAVAAIGTIALIHPTDPVRNPIAPVAGGLPDAPPDAPPGGKEMAERRRLDLLRPNVHHVLLDRIPFSLTGVESGPQKWRWEAGHQTVEATWPDTLLLELGTTTREAFLIEAGIKQIRWTGNIGLFFGYREDQAVRLAKRPDTTFAQFQMVTLSVLHRNGQELHFVERAKAELSFNDRGAINFNMIFDRDHRQQVPNPVRGEAILSLQIDHGELFRARLGNDDLANLCRAEANAQCTRNSYSGGLGLVSLGHHAMFGNARFLASTEK